MSQVRTSRRCGSDRGSNHKSRYYDRMITLYTPKETVKEILLKDYQARVEHRNASCSNTIGDEKIRTMTVPGQTLERDKSVWNQVVTSIKERNCRRQINKIGGDMIWEYFSIFYGTEHEISVLRKNDEISRSSPDTT